MKRTSWTTTVVILLGTLWLLSGIAWADPTGPANVPQVLNVSTSRADFTESRTFLTNEIFEAFATYYDPNPACVGVPPGLIQVLFFNLEGRLIFTCPSNSPKCVVQESGAAGSKYRNLAAFVDAGALPAGAYNLTFLVKECGSGPNIFVSGSYLIRVLAP